MFIFGAGSAYIRRRFQLNLININILGLLDNDETIWGNIIDGMIIDDPRHIGKYDFDYILIASSYFKEIEKQLLDLGVKETSIININILISPSSSGRYAIANNFIKYDDGYYSGVEIGGANRPIQIMDTRISIKQVDYCEHSQTNSLFSHLELVKVDIVDNGETLDDKDPNRDRDNQHYFDIGKELLTEEEKLIRQRWLDSDERIHFHVWNSDSFIEFIYEVKKYFGNTFYIEQVGIIASGIASNEIICVLKKVG